MDGWVELEKKEKKQQRQQQEENERRDKWGVARLTLSQITFYNKINGRSERNNMQSIIHVNPMRSFDVEKLT